MPSLQADFLYAQENTPSHYPVKCSTIKFTGEGSGMGALFGWAGLEID